MAAGASAPIPIYISSSLDTALGLAVSSEDTILSLKRKLEQVHADVFPGIGDIIVKSFKIKSGQHFFNLSDSIPVKAVFHRLKGLGFLYMDAAVAPQQRARMPDRESCKPTGLLQNQNTEEAYEIETHGQVVGVIEHHNNSGIEQNVDQGKTNPELEEIVTTMGGSVQRGEPSGKGKPVKRKERNMSSQEITDQAFCSDENTGNKRWKKQIVGPSPDREYEVPPNNVQENNTSSETKTASEGPKGDSPMTGNPGDTPYSAQYGNVPTETPQLEEGRLVPEKDAISDEDAEPDNQLTAEQTTAADGRGKESIENCPRKEDLSDKTARTPSMNPGVCSTNKRIHKETKATSLFTSVHENLAQHIESCKGKESNTSFEIETCKRTGDVLTNCAEASFIVPTSKDQNGNSLNQGRDVICMAKSLKKSSEAGAKKISKKRRKTEDSCSEVPLAKERKYEGEVQKSIVIYEKDTATKNTMRHSSVAKPGKFSSFAPNGRDPKEGSLDEMKLSSQTQVKEKASVPMNATEEPVSEGEEKEKRKKLTTPEVIEAGSKAHASDKKMSQTKNPREGKSKEKEGRSIILKDDVSKGNGITGEDSTEKASVPSNDFEEQLSKGNKREERKKVTTPEVLEPESKAYASEKNARKGKSKEKEGRIISLGDNIPKGDGITGEASVPSNGFEEQLSKGNKREKSKKVTTPEVLEPESKAYAREKKASIGKSEEKEGRIISSSGNVPKGDGNTGDDNTEKASVHLIDLNESEEPVSKDKKIERRKKVTTPEILEAESKAYASEKKARKGKSEEKEGRIISSSGNVPKGDGNTVDDNTEKASVHLIDLNESEEPVSKGKKTERRKKVTTPEILEAESKAYASEKKACKGKSEEKEGRIISSSGNVPKGDGNTGDDNTEKASVHLIDLNESEEPVSKDKKTERRKKVTTPEILKAESKAYASEKKARKGKFEEKEGRIIILGDSTPKGDGITGEDSTEDEDELDRFRVEFRNVPIKNNGEKLNALGVEGKALGLSPTVFPVQQCRVSGGHNWRCKLEALPGKKLCAYHETRRQNKASRQNSLFENPACGKELSPGRVLRSAKKERILT